MLSNVQSGIVGLLKGLAGGFSEGMSKNRMQEALAAREKQKEDSESLDMNSPLGVKLFQETTGIKVDPGDFGPGTRIPFASLGTLLRGQGTLNNSNKPKGSSNSIDPLTGRMIINAPKYQDVVNRYIDLKNIYDKSDPNARQTLVRQMLAHGTGAPLNQWMADDPSMTPTEHMAAAKVKTLYNNSQQLGYGEQLRFMHAMETLNQQTGGARPPTPEAVQHVYDTTPGLDAPAPQFATMLGAQLDSAVPWKGIALKAKLQGNKDLEQQAESARVDYKSKFHQVHDVQYDQNNDAMTPGFGYGQPAKNGIGDLGAVAPSGGPQIDQSQPPQGGGKSVVEKNAAAPQGTTIAPEAKFASY